MAINPIFNSQGDGDSKTFSLEDILPTRGPDTGGDLDRSHIDNYEELDEVSERRRGRGIERLITPGSRQWRYSFSGADAEVYTWFPGNRSDVRQLPSVHTISVSVHEAKGPTRSLGYRGIRGMSRGVRTIAGSLILTVINDHPLAPVMEQYMALIRRHGYRGEGWSIDRDLVGVGTLFDEYSLDSVLPTLLPPFDLAVQYVSEMANGRETLKYQDVPEIPGDAKGKELRQARRAPPTTRFEPEHAGLLLRGVEFQDDGLVTSVNDIVSEMTFSFIAHDYKPLAAVDVGQLFSDGYRESAAIAAHNEIMRRCWS